MHGWPLPSFCIAGLRVAGPFDLGVDRSCVYFGAVAAVATAGWASGCSGGVGTQAREAATGSGRGIVTRPWGVGREEPQAIIRRSWHLSARGRPLALAREVDTRSEGVGHGEPVVTCRAFARSPRCLLARTLQWLAASMMAFSFA